MAQENMLELGYKVAAIGGVLWGIVSSIAYIPLKRRLTKIEEKVDNTMSRDQTVEAIELRQQPLVEQVERLNHNTEHLSECISKLTSTIGSMQRWQARQEGRQER